MKFTLRTACLAMATLSDCAASPERPAASAGRVRAEVVVEGLSPGLDDRENYCLASTGNALQCSRFESWLAGWGKEAGDALGAGDASREDVDARCVEQPDLMMWPGPERDGRPACP
jgi:hypothetical protein